MCVFRSTSPTISNPRRSFKKLTPEEVSDVIYQYQHGFPISRIAKQYGCDASSITYQLKKHGVHKPKFTTNRQNPKEQ